MDPIIHSLIAVGCMAGFYYLGRWSGKNDLSSVIEALLETSQRWLQKVFASTKRRHE